MAGKRSTSKKRSATKSKEPPPELVFFVDRSIESRSLVRALEEAGIEVERHSDYFRPDAPDQEWLTRVGMEGWIVLTKDARIRRRPLERDALIAAGVGAFVLVAANLPADEMIQVIERHLPRMLRIARGQEKPFIAGVSRTRVVLYPVRTR